MAETLDTATTTAAPAAAADTVAGSVPAAGADLIDQGTAPVVEGAPAGDLLSGDGAAQQEGEPVEYAFEAPEGVELAEAALEAFKGTAKELGLSQAQFQKLVQYDLDRTQAANEAAVESWNTRVNEWRTAAMADKEFGGKDFQANVATAMGVVSKFGDADLQALLRSPSESNPNGLAIGNNPAVLRFLNRIGKAMGDPKFVSGGHSTPAPTQEDALRSMYPSMFKQ